MQNNHKQKNMIAGCIYQHPGMDPAEFNDLYLKTSLIH